MFLNTALFLQACESKLIISVCVEAASVKTPAENQCENILGNRKMTRYLQRKTEIQFAKTHQQ